MSSVLKVTLAGVCLALCAAGFYLLDWQPRLARLAQASQAVALERAEVEKTRRDLAQLPDLTTQVEAAESQLRTLVASGMTKEDPPLMVANYVAELERMVRCQRAETDDAGFDIQAITPGEEHKAEQTPEGLQGFPTRVFQLQMAGRYDTLVDFLRQLGALKLDRLITINKLALGVSGQEGGSPCLSIQIPMTAYVRSGT